MSVTVRDFSFSPPLLEVLQEEDVTDEALDEFVEMLLTVPNTILNSTFSNGKLIVFDLAGLKPKHIFIKSTGPIGIVQYMTVPSALYFQPCRSLAVLTYEPVLNPPTQIRLLNLNPDPVDVKLIISSKN